MAAAAVVAGGAAVELEKGDGLGLQCTGEGGSYTRQNGWVPLQLSESTDIKGVPVVVGDGCSCSWRCSSSAEEGQRVRASMRRGKGGAILGKTALFQCQVHQSDIVLRKRTNHSVREKPASSSVHRRLRQFKAPLVQLAKPDWNGDLRSLVWFLKH